LSPSAAVLQSIMAAMDLQPTPGTAASRPVRSEGRVLAALHALLDVLANPQLRRLQLAWSGCITAEWAQAVALGVYAFREQGVIGVGVVGLIRTLPAAVVGPFAAGLADRFRRERVLTAVLVVRAGALAAVATALWLGLPAAVAYALAAVDATVYTLFWPAQSSLLPELARSPEELTASNVASTTVENLGTLVGPIIGGVGLSMAGVAPVFATSAAMLGASAVVASGIHTTVVSVRSAGAGSSPVAELLAGFRTLAQQPRPRLVVALYLTQTFGVGAMTVLVVVTAIELLGIGEAGVGYLNAAVGAGGLIGALATLALVGRRRLAVGFQLGLITWGVALALIGVWPRAATAVLLLAAVGSANALIDVTALTLLQRIVAERVLARVLGVFEGLWWGMQGLGAVAASLLISAAGARAALLATGALLPATGLLAGKALAALDADASPPQPQLTLLRGVPLFAPLPVLTLERLAFALQPVSVAAGEVIVRRGDEGDHFYVIAEGQVEVTATEHSTGPTTTEGLGDFFGEIALLRGVPRTATVTATTDVALLALERGEFIAAVTGHAGSAMAADAVVVDRLTPGSPS
jgi:predicted MFS family arabinose efflux permease